MKGPYNFGGMTRERMKRESGLIWPCPTETHPGTNLRYVRGEDPNIPADHPDKIWFYGNPNGKANIWMRPYKGAAEEPDQEYPFYLTSMRVIDHWHTATMTGKVPELLKANPAAFVEVNTEDASRLNIKNGDLVVVERGAMRLPCQRMSTTPASRGSLPCLSSTRRSSSTSCSSTPPTPRPASRSTRSAPHGSRRRNLRFPEKRYAVPVRLWQIWRVRPSSQWRGRGGRPRVPTLFSIPFSDKAGSSSVRLKGKRCPYHCAERGTAPLTRLLGT